MADLLSTRASEDAWAIVKAHPPIDLHADTLMWSRWIGYDLFRRHEAPLPMAALGGHVDVPRMREGGMGAQFFGLVSLPLSKRARGMVRVVDAQIDELLHKTTERPQDLRLVRTRDDLVSCERDGAIAALLGIEGAHALEGDLDRLTHFARRGVRYLGLLHFSDNEAGCPAYGRGSREGQGLTAWGRDLVRHCEDQHVIVDLSHINKRGFLDACEMARVPPIVSHTGVAGAFEHWRNIDDEQLRAVGDKGGVCGVIFCPQFVGGDGLEPVVRHLRHIIDVAGEDVPALGSDWDGFIIPTGPLRDPRGLPHLVDALLAGGITEEAIAKILRGNILRVLGDA